MIVRPQIYRTSNGIRLITHGVFYGETFLCYASCFCLAMKASRLLSER